ncbi:MAG: protein kinase [Bradymonadales bacterium]|nr:protein kinase [Bradymonadales bacterium]
MSAMSLHIGDRLVGRYEIIRVLGEGGFAAVYLASDRRAGGLVAIKVLRPERSGEEDFAERFRQEVMLVRQLRHPNTIKIWDLGSTDDGLLYMVMEYVEGETLASLLQTNGAIPPARAALIVSQVLQSLGEAHQRGIIHRDLKPGNIMVSPLAEGSDFVKVLDFGIAKAVNTDLSQVNTKTGLVMCTPRYAPPEILLKSHIGPHSDVYAVGLILAEILTGRSPFEGLEEAAVIAQQLQPSPLVFPPQLMEGPLGSIVSVATRKSPAERYPDALHMLAALRTATPASMASPRSASTARRPSPAKSKRASGRRTVLALLLMLTATLVAVALSFAFTRNPASDRAEMTAGPEVLLSPASSPGTDPDPRDLLPPYTAPTFSLLAFSLDAEMEGASPSGLGAQGLDRSGVDRGENPDAMGDRGQSERSAHQAALDPSTDDTLAQRGGDPQALARMIEVAETPQAERLTLLTESAQVQARALGMLQDALRAGTIPEEQRQQVLDNLVRVGGRLISVLLDLGMCTTAGLRLDEIEDTLGANTADWTEYLVSYRARVDACHAQQVQPLADWDPLRYLELAQVGANLSAMGQNMPEENSEQRIAFLVRGVSLMREAIGQLKGALLGGLLSEDLRAQGIGQLFQLHAEIVTSLATARRCSAARLQIEEARGDSLALQVPGSLEQVEARFIGCQEPLLSDTAFGWEQVVLLSDLGEDLYQQAVSIQASEEAAESTPEVVEEDQAVTQDLEAATGEGANDALQVDPAEYSSQVRITSTPSGARVWLGRERLGRTPFDQVLTSPEARISLTLRADGYRPADVAIDLRRPRVSHRVELVETVPFGQIDRLLGQ